MTLALVEVVKNIKNVMVRKFKVSSLVLVLSLIGTVSFGQVDLKVNDKLNEAVRMKNARIDSTRFQGFRIQIARDKNKNTVLSAQAKFVRLFPEYAGRTYLLYQQPYWKMRVGDFYRELDAQPLLLEIEKGNYFSLPTMVPDLIRRPML